MDSHSVDEEQKGIKKFVNRFRGGSISSKSRPTIDDAETDGFAPLRRNSSPKGPKSSKGNKKQQQQQQHISFEDLSMAVWNEAYESLRDSPATAALVVAYESIIAHELPDSLKTGGMNTSFRNRSAEERLALLTCIANNGLEKRRGSKTSQVEEVSRTIIDDCKSAIRHSLTDEPAAAIAWAGFCTLTPLLLDPILRLDTMRVGLFHVTGRIGWYMSLPYLLMRDSWRDDADFDRFCDKTRDRISRIARKALEFEMSCICATASAWNAQAKNTVRWSSLDTLVQDLIGMGGELAQHIDSYASDPVAREFLRRDHDFQEQQPGADTDSNGPQSAIAA